MGPNILLNRIHKSQSPLELLIGITVYNEKPFDLYYTLKGVCENINDFALNRVYSHQIACVIVVDGIEKLLENALIKNYNHFTNVFSMSNKS